MFRFIVLFLALLNVTAFAPGLGMRTTTLAEPSSIVMMAKGRANPALFKTGLEGKAKKAAPKKGDKVERRTFDGSVIFPKPWEKPGSK